MSVFRGWFGHRSRDKPRPPVAFGYVCHRLDPDDVAWLRARGIRDVRLSLYPDGTGAWWINQAMAAGFRVVVVTYRPLPELERDAREFPGVTWQVGNEPDWRVLRPSDVAEWARPLDGIAPQVGCGLAHGTPADWIARYCDALPSGVPVAVHGYGDNLAVGIMEMITRVPAHRRVWLTEYGSTSSSQIAPAESAVRASRVERAYRYALWSPDDGYGVLPPSC